MNHHPLLKPNGKSAQSTLTCMCGGLKECIVVNQGAATVAFYTHLGEARRGK